MEALVESQGREGSRDHGVRRAGIHRVGQLGGVTGWGLVGSWGQESWWGHVSNLLVMEERVQASVDGTVWSGLKNLQTTDQRPC